MADDESVPCHVCGATFDPDQQGDRTWLFVEVERLHGPGYWQAVFCSEAHAAQWFGPPMPPPDVVTGAPALRSPLGRFLDALVLPAVILAVIATIALAVLGAVSVLS